MTPPTLRIKFAGDAIARNVAVAQYSRLGPLLLNQLVTSHDITLNTITFEDASPIIDFLETGKYSPRLTRDPDVLKAERASYDVFYGSMHCPEFIRDLESVICQRIVHGMFSVQEVRERFAGYESIQTICNTLDIVLPEVASASTNLGLTRAVLERELEREGGLFIFHGDVNMTIVIDTEYTDDGETHTMHQAIIRHSADLTHSRLNKRYVCFTTTSVIDTPRTLSVVPSDDAMPLKYVQVLLCFYSDSVWHIRANAEGPEFPAIHTIDAIIGTSETPTGVGRFIFARNDLWKYAVIGRCEEDEPNGFMGKM